MRLIVIITFLNLAAFSQVPIQFYDFEQNANRSSSELTAELIINSIAGSELTSVGGALSGGVGNPNTGSAVHRTSWDGNSIVDPGAAASEYMEFNVNTSGFSEIFLDADAYATLVLGTAGNIGVLYSTNGSTFNAVSVQGLSTSFANYQWDLSNITGVNNVNEVTFRLYAYGDALGTSELYVDNLRISARKIITTKTLADYSKMDDANGSSDFPVFKNLIIDGGGTIATLSSNLNISDTLSLTNGIFATGSYTLTVDSNCTVENYSTGSYVNGNMAHTFHTKPLVQSKFYPVGSLSAYRPAQITISDVTTAGTVTVEHINSAPNYAFLPPGITNLSSVRYWNVSVDGGMTFGAANTYGVQLYFGSDDGVNSAPDVKVVRGINGGSWAESDNSGTGADWVFGSFNDPTDNSFTFGDAGENPLPVELTEFNYFLEKQNLIIYWSTATEINSFLFEVQRKAVDTDSWIKRGDVVASGVSNSPKHYTFFEEDPVVGTSLYRLKVIDIDGSFEFSQMISVEYDDKLLSAEDEVNYEFKLFQNYPNPFNPSTEITYSVPSQCYITLSVYDSVGQWVTDLSSGIIRAGKYRVQWNASPYSSGIYYLRIIAKSIDGNRLFNQTKKMVFVK